ncbi:MAG: hypothetical protein R2695_19665 [Acidimicrobiales bacterium]
MGPAPVTAVLTGDVAGMEGATTVGSPGSTPFPLRRPRCTPR